MARAARKPRSAPSRSAPADDGFKPDPNWKRWKPTPAEKAELYELAEGLKFGRIHYAGGHPGTGSEIKNPPCNGWSSAFLIDKGAKLVTIFCPYTMEGFQVSRKCGDLKSMQRDYAYVPNTNEPGTYTEQGFKPWTKERTDRLVKIILDNWSMRTRHSMPTDFDTAALVLRMLGAEVPLHVRKESDEPEKPRGGKAADDILGLLKPVKRESKRGKVLEFFLPQPRSIREAMAEFGYSRSNVLSHLFILQKDHGIGYALTGDAATITLPAGCTDPFAEGQ